MATWIERYNAGEHVKVWEEMQALGAEIAKPAHRKAARDVVDETVQRARQNVMRLFDALPQLGYRFRGAPEPAAPDYPLELRIQGALEYVRAAGGKKYRNDPWSHPVMAWIDEEEIELPAHHRNGRPARANFRPPGPRTAGVLDAMEARLGGPLPLATRCWFETVGSVDLAGTHPILNRSGEIATLRAVLDPDSAEFSASTSVGGEFVASIRHAFAWGGFPGWADKPDPPERELAWLRSKLLAL